MTTNKRRIGLGSTEMPRTLVVSDVVSLLQVLQVVRREREGQPRG